MQLPIYLYLSSNLNFPNMQIVGFYLQKILSNNINNKKDYDEAREDSLKLEGYSLDNQNILSKFDKTYSDSKLIKGMKVTANGDFYKNSKVLSEEEISNLLKAVTTSIDDSIDNILEADFEINPKVINGENVSCSFCEYRDICYRREEDINYINDEEKEDEENAVSNI